MTTFDIASFIKLNNETIADTFQNAFIVKRTQANLSTDAKVIVVSCGVEQFTKFLDSFGIQFSITGKYSGGYFWNDLMFGKFKTKNSAINMTVCGDVGALEVFEKSILSSLPNNPCFITYVYDPEYLESMVVPVNSHRLPVDEMYPCLNGEPLASYFDRFVNSTANILVLIGPPGTGKTSMLRGLLSHTRKSATLAYHEKILGQDAFFVEWLKSDDSFMILEDSDTMIMPREDGNQMMSRFLNLGDGLISFDSKKLIFSTNLPSKASIDEALLRPGRCFDVLEFRNLTPDEADKLATKVGKVDFDSSVAKSYTVAEVFAQGLNEVKKQKSSFGFI